MSVVTSSGRAWQASCAPPTPRPSRCGSSSRRSVSGGGRAIQARSVQTLGNRPPGPVSTQRPGSRTSVGGGPAVAAPRPAKRLRFTAAEDAALQAIVDEHDSSHATSSSTGELRINWSAVAAEFAAACPGTPRTAASLRSRWDRLQVDDTRVAVVGAAQGSMLLIMRKDREQMIRQGLWSDEAEEDHCTWEGMLHGHAVPHEHPATAWPAAASWPTAAA